MPNDQPSVTNDQRRLMSEFDEELEHIQVFGVPLTAVTRIRRIAEKMLAQEGGRDAA